ncbi:hypothetical protein J6590_001053 [Homalodisca vitripennis]|nr:hypothetical protein J6590_001053 [Homalodisca vitripennis]
MRISSVLKQVSVEPMLVLYYVAAAIATLAGTNLVLLKACNPHHSPAEGDTCDEVAAQKVVTAINTWRPSFEYSIPVLFILFAGAWSDAHGKRRKPLMILPIAGEIVTLFYITSSVYFWKWTPEMTALFESLFRGLTGGRTCFSFGAITYIADNTYPEQRTFRLAIITALIFISSPIGNALGGILRVTFGFYVVFNVCLILNLLALLSGLVLMKRYNDEERLEKSCGLPELKKTWKTVFKERTGHNRTIILLMLIVSPLFGGCLIGEYSVLYFYLRYKFHWGEADYGFYSAFRMSLTFFGTLISIGVLSRMCRLSDEVIGLIATTSQIVAALGNTFAQFQWQMFLYPTLDLMHGAIYTVGHSIVSKVVDSVELGKVNSVLGTVDSLIPLIVFPLYNRTYSMTFQEKPGTFFLISVAFASVTWVIFLTVIVLRMKQSAKVHTTVN